MLSKYSAALIAVSITLVAALAQISGGVTWTDAIQLALLGINAVLIYVVPLAATARQSLFKTVAAVIVAVLTGLAPLAVPNHVWNGQEIAMVVLAALQALGAHVGVKLRSDARALQRDARGRFTAAN